MLLVRHLLSHLFPRYRKTLPFILYEPPKSMFNSRKNPQGQRLLQILKYIPPLHCSYSIPSSEPTKPIRVTAIANPKSLFASEIPTCKYVFPTIANEAATYKQSETRRSMVRGECYDHAWSQYCGVSGSELIDEYSKGLSYKYRQ